MPDFRWARRPSSQGGVYCDGRIGHNREFKTILAEQIAKESSPASGGGLAEPSL